MKGLMSLWTGTGKFKLCRQNAVIHTLAVCMAGRHFPVTELVTDSLGLEISDRLGWNFSIYTRALDDLADEGTSHIWALGKLMAASMQSEPFCHIDNDVILHKPLPERILKARFLAQSKDIPRYYSSREMVKALKMAQINRNSIAYNLGIVGGCDAHHLQQYALEAMERALNFHRSPINGTTISMVVEQHYFGEYARRHQIRVEELIPMDFTDEDVADVGYTHLIGDTKRLPKWALKCEARLANEFTEAHKAFTRGWEVLKAKL